MARIFRFRSTSQQSINCEHKECYNQRIEEQAEPHSKAVGDFCVVNFFVRKQEVNGYGHTGTTEYNQTANNDEDNPVAETGLLCRQNSCSWELVDHIRALEVLEGEEEADAGE